MSLAKFESMLKTNDVYFFDSTEFEGIIQYYLDNGKHSLAKKAVKLGLDQHPASVILKLLKVELLVFEDKLQKASAILEEVEAVEPNNEDLLIHKATILSKNNHHLAAIDTFKMVLPNTDEKPDIWAMIGMEYLYLDDFENARLNFANCIEVDYEDYSSLYNVVYCFDMENNHIEAIDFLNNYIEKNPYCEVAWHQLGRQYFVLKNYKEALRSFDYAVIIDEGFVGGYLEKAKTLEELGRFEEAIENYLITLELDDPTAFVYLRMGECYEQLGVLDTAVKYYKNAVNEDPLLDRGWLLLTKLYQEEAQYEKALYYISKALQIDEENAMYWRTYAKINLHLNFYEETVKGFHKCLDLNDNSLEIFVGLADVLLFIGDFDDALKIMVKAKNFYKAFAEIEYRLCGLFMLTGEEKYGLLHLKNGLAIDAEYSGIVGELYPTVFESDVVQTIIRNYRKATE